VSTKERGDRAEARAAEHLRAAGYTLVTRNYRIKGGEIDLVARDGGVLCFVEVRSRADASHGLPEETIGRTKRRRIARAAEHYLAARRLHDAPCRFDVVAIDGDGIRLYKDAFRLDDC